ncbi:hypothetical protein EG68_05262 [Paragonimus skrjabini miyazakii]|uniref:Cep192/Spd-2-like domain-containing protein n=1 Tax=Paragonimus skrjabini miyazakii TaxID=59628 RepID=A0A8S9YVV6_9TREM|nr:hypothetical protein EG68_05262 [Paragonimus skrjabini miyazakii]
MADTNDLPVLFKSMVKMPTLNGSACEQTILGTPVPVAHSTVSQRPRRTYVVCKDETVPPALPALETSTYTIPEKLQVNQPGISSSSSANKDSILNLDSMQGLSGSVLDQSVMLRNTPHIHTQATRLPSHIASTTVFKAPTEPESTSALSVEEVEAENQAIQIDQAELQLLEDAFSDLDCAATETEYTLPTKACATMGNHVIGLSGTCSPNEGDKANDSGTISTISSLPSVMDISQLHESRVTEVKRAEMSLTTGDKMGLDCVLFKSDSQPCGKTEIESKAIPTSQSNLDCQPPPSPLIFGGASGVSPTLTSMFRSPPTSLTCTQRRFSHLPCLTGLSSIWETESGESINNAQPSFMLSTSSSTAPNVPAKDVVSSHPPSPQTCMTVANSNENYDGLPQGAVAADSDDRPMRHAASSEPGQSEGFVEALNDSHGPPTGQNLVPSVTADQDAMKNSKTRLPAISQEVTTSTFVTTLTNKNSVSQDVKSVSTTTSTSSQFAGVLNVVPSSDAEHQTNRIEETALLDSDQSGMLVSCLHMSDVDGLLDMFHKKNNNMPQADVKKDQIVPRDLNRRVIARQRLARLRSRQDLEPTTVPSAQTEKRTLSWLSVVQSAQRDSLTQDSHDLSPKPVDENNPPLPPFSCPTCEPSFQSTIGDPPGAPLPDSQIRRSSIPVLKERQLSQLNRTFVQSQTVTNMPSDTHDSPQISSKSPVLSPLLSNTDCLIFCGAVCGQIQRQQMLIKHQLDKPVNVRLLVSPGGDVFKLVDERGYLLTGSHTVHLPPGLEYTVHVAYAAHHPMTWDIGHLQLAIDQPERSVWKVRLIGYSNSCQLECSCCTRLSSEVYWTTASRVLPPVDTRPVPRFGVQSAENRSSAVCGASVTCVVLTNFGARAAWVVAFVEPLETGSSKPVLTSGGSGFDCARPTSAIVVEPNRMVIGPKQSQNIIITLRPDLMAARILLFYGDEVLRHQVRQHYILSGHSNSVNTGHTRRHVKVGDLMCDFANELPFQLVEMPTQLRHPIRPEDWRQALSKQLRLRERLVLNVYVNESDLPDSAKNLGAPELQIEPEVACQGRTCSASSPSLLSIMVQEDAFSNCRSSTARMDQMTRSSERTKLQPSVRNGDSVDHADTFLRLDPPNKLVFPTPQEHIKSEAKFILHLQESPSGQTENNATVYRVMCLAQPISRIHQSAVKDESALNSSSLESHPLRNERVFMFVPSTSPSASSAAPSDKHPCDGQTCGLLSTAPHLVDLHLSFGFRPPLGIKTVCYRQHWQLTVWLQPATNSPSQSSQRRLSASGFDITHPSTRRFTFSRLLEGQFSPIQLQIDLSPKASCDRPSISSTSKHPSSADVQAMANRILSVANPKRPAMHKLGPMLIQGLPVNFAPVDSASNDSPVSTYQLELFNRMKKNTIFAQLELPKPPFHVVKPTQTRFRILPNRWVHLHLAFRPTEVGNARSVLRIRVTALPDINAVDSVVETQSPYESYKTDIPLFGVLR